MPSDIIFLAKTNFRKKDQIFGIKRADRRQHMYVVGKTGVGKTAFLKNMALQDIQNGEGLAIIDPHGEFVEDILNSIPPHRINDVVYFNPSDMEYPVSFNILEVADPRYKHLVASGLIGIFTKIWANVWSARMEYILANCILALLDTPGTTLLGIPRMLVDRDYRQKIINNLKDPVVKSFWVNEYEEWDPRYRNEAIAPVQNKVGQFLNVSLIRNIVGQSKNTIDIDEIMNTRKILLVNVSKGRIGEDNSAILGAMIITKIQLSAMERVRIPEEKRRDFYLYVDEFQNFATDSFVNILSEARKYRLNLIIAHQYVGQLVTETTTAVRDAVFGNVGTMVSFRVGATDAEFLELEFTPEFLQDDLIRLPNYNVYMKLMIDGITSRAFSAKTLPPVPIVDAEHKNREKIIRVARERYAKDRGDAEEEITRWSGNLEIQDTLISSTSRPARAGGQSQNRSGTLYDAKCSNCGKSTKVVFQPSKDRPVYCKSCLKKIGDKKIAVSPKETASFRKRKSESAADLGKLGIEFEPARQSFGVGGSSQSSRQKSANNNDKYSNMGEDLKIENIPFHMPKRPKEEKALPTGRQAKRKEINLSELKKALEESLAPLEADNEDLKDDKKINKPLMGLENKEKEEKEEEPAFAKGSSEAKEKSVEPISEAKEKTVEPASAFGRTEFASGETKSTKNFGGPKEEMSAQKEIEDNKKDEDHPVKFAKGGVPSETEQFNRTRKKGLINPGQKIKF